MSVEKFINIIYYIDKSEEENHNPPHRCSEKLAQNTIPIHGKTFKNTGYLLNMIKYTVDP